MKVAVLISGQIGDKYQTIIDNVIKPYNADTFVCYASDSPQVSEEELKSIWNPKAYYYGKFPEILKPMIESASKFQKYPESNVESIIKMSWGIWKASNIQIYDYDAIVRCRADLEIHNPLEIKLTEDIWIPIGWDHRGGYNDTFAYGHQKAMRWYCELYNQLLMYGNNNFIVHPESYLKTHLHHSQYGIMRWHYPITLRDMKLNELEYRQK